MLTIKLVVHLPSKSIDSHLKNQSEQLIVFSRSDTTEQKDLSQSEPICIPLAN